MNPYASFLGGRDPLPVITTTSRRLQELFANVSDADANRTPAPNKWSLRQILCHLADTEIAFAFRLRQALSETNHVIQPFDQDGWAAQYSAYDTKSALALFEQLRAWNVALIRSLPADAFDRALSHPERGPMVYRTLVETMAGHDENHLRQIEALAGSSGAARA